jgi:methyltransferase (TIGR00027 family)
MSQSAAALVGAFVRAYHMESLEGAEDAAIFRDNLARGLLGEEYEALAGGILLTAGLMRPLDGTDRADALDRLVRRRLGPVYLSRAVFAEHMLENAALLGTRQYLIFGAGLGSFAHRLPHWAKDLLVVEIDQPLAVMDKRRRVAELGLDAPAGLRYAAADIRSHIWPAVVAACPGFEPDARSFVSLTGLTFDMGEGELNDFFARLSPLLAPGSAVALDYPTRPEAAPQEPGSPLYRFSYDGLTRLLERHGLLIYDHLEPRALARQHFAHYNAAFPDRPFAPPGGMGFCLAVRR